MKRTTSCLAARCALLLLFSFLSAPCLRAQVPSALTSALSGTVQADQLAFTKTSGALEKSRIVSLSWKLDNRHALKLSGGYAKYYSSRLASDIKPFCRSAWKMRSVPISLEYSYALTRRSRRLVPSLSVGGSYYLARSRVVLAPGVGLPGGEGYGYAADAPTLPREDAPKKYFNGLGYGVHAGLAVRYDVGHDLFVQGLARARYIDGHAFTLSDDAPGRFTTLDVALGFGFKL